MTGTTPDGHVPATAQSLLWAAHGAVWMLAGLAARLSRTGSQLEAHITGLNGAELAPDHLRHILTAPTTEFKAISLIGVVVAAILALMLRTHGPAALRWVTLSVAAICLLVYFAGYGLA